MIVDNHCSKVEIEKDNLLKRIINQIMISTKDTNQHIKIKGKKISISAFQEQGLEIESNDFSVMEELINEKKREMQVKFVKLLMSCLNDIERKLINFRFFDFLQQNEIIKRISKYKSNSGLSQKYIRIYEKMRYSLTIEQLKKFLSEI